MNTSEEKPDNPKRSPFALRFSIRLMLGLLTVAGVSMAYLDYVSRREKPLPLSWDFGTGQNVKWIAQLGTQTYANPTVHDGRVFVGSNNGNGYDPNFPPNVDLGVMLCFDAKDGKFLWQHSHKKLAEGRVQDWPLQGISSQVFADRDRLWYVSNRCEVVCLDTEGFYDEQNDGDTTETNTEEGNADVVWTVDMRKRFGVFPHNMSHCNVVVDDWRVYVKTSNGVDESHMNLPAPNAPSFVVLDRKTGETIWTDNSPKHIEPRCHNRGKEADPFSWRRWMALQLRAWRRRQGWRCPALEVRLQSEDRQVGNGWIWHTQQFAYRADGAR